MFMAELEAESSLLKRGNDNYFNKNRDKGSDYLKEEVFLLKRCK